RTRRERRAGINAMAPNARRSHHVRAGGLAGNVVRGSSLSGGTVLQALSHSLPEMSGSAIGAISQPPRVPSSPHVRTTHEGAEAGILRLSMASMLHMRGARRTRHDTVTAGGGSQDGAPGAQGWPGGDGRGAGGGR